MENLKVAFATDDGKSFIDRHFGDADHFDIYELAISDAKFIKRIENTTEEDSNEIHADPKKAKGILGLLKSQDVQVVVSKIFGPNIKRIKSKFVCVLIKKDEIADCFNTLQNNWQIINDEWAKGEKREHINLKKT